MTKTEIKQSIHSLVETMDNENVLNQVKKMLESISKDSVSFEKLSKAEQLSIQKGIEQINRGERIDYDDIKKNYPEWLRK